MTSKLDQLRSITTVVAGEFQTCKHRKNLAGVFDITYYYGANIPFAVVKSISVKVANPTDVKITELKSFNRGL